MSKATEEGTGRNVGKLGALIVEGNDDGKFIKTNVDWFNRWQQR